MLPFDWCGVTPKEWKPFVIEYEVNEELGYVTVSFAGELVFEELRSLEERLLDDSCFDRQYPRIYDLTGVELDLNTSELIQMVDIYRGWDIPDETKVALVGSSAGLATINLFGAHFSDQSLRTCRSIQQATQWLNEDSLPDLSADDRYKLIVLRGNITLDDVMRAQSSWYAARDYDEGRPVLWDLRNTSAGSSLEEMKERVPFVVSSSKNAGRSGKTSVLVNSHMMEMLFRQLIELGDWRDASRLFNDEQEAIAWLMS